MQILNTDTRRFNDDVTVTVEQEVIRGKVPRAKISTHTN